MSLAQDILLSWAFQLAMRCSYWRQAADNAISLVSKELETRSTWSAQLISQTHLPRETLGTSLLSGLLSLMYIEMYPELRVVIILRLDVICCDRVASEDFVVFQIGHGVSRKNDAYILPKELEEKVAKLHIPHTVQSSPPLLRKKRSTQVSGMKTLQGW